MMNRPVNGANVIVVAPGCEEILVVRHTYGERCWALPGGGIDPVNGEHKGETSVDAAIRETREEAGVTLKGVIGLVAILSQRPEGLVTLYEARSFSGVLKTYSSNEISGVQFMSLPEIFCGKHHFGLGYKRMIAIWHQTLYSNRIYEGRLADRARIILNNQVLWV